MDLFIQMQQCFTNEHAITSSRVVRGDEHLDGLAAPLLTGRLGWRETGGTSETSEGSRSEVRGSGCKVPKTQHTELRTSPHAPRSMASSRGEAGIMPQDMVSSPPPPSNEVLRKMPNRFS